VPGLRCLNIDQHDELAHRQNCSRFMSRWNSSGCAPASVTRRSTTSPCHIATRHTSSPPQSAQQLGRDCQDAAAYMVVCVVNACGPMEGVVLRTQESDVCQPIAGN